MQLYASSHDCFWTILREEGCCGFYKGVGSNILRGLGAALVLVLYDELRKML